MPTYPVGFLPYGSDDDSIIVQEPLTSSAGVFTAVGADAGTEVFSSDGVQLSKTLSLTKTDLTSAQKTALLSGGCVTIYIERDFVDEGYLGGSVVADNEYLMNFYGSNHMGIYKGNGSNQMTARVNSTAFAAGARTRNASKDTYVRFDLSWVGNLATVYLDYFPITTLAFAPTANQFDAIYAGGRLGSSPQSHKVKNYQLGTRPVMLPVHPDFSSIVSVGHSFGVNGDYPTANALIKGDGGLGDERTFVTIQRELAKKGFGIGGNRIDDYSVAGEKTADLAAQVTSALAAHSTVTAAIIQIGINDVITNTVSATNQTDIQTEVDRLTAVGCKYILLNNCTTTAMDAAYLPVATYTARVDEFNGYVDALVAANSEVYLVDMFNHFGGHSNYDVNDFAAGPDIHPSEQGYNKIGKKNAEVLLNALQ